MRSYRDGQVEIASTQLTCRIDDRDVLLNDDHGEVRGGLYRRFPWFGTDVHDPMPVVHSIDQSSVDHNSVILRVGSRPDRVWHFWAVKIRIRVSQGALVQVGFDYWRNSSVGYGTGGNNHEAGASSWYFASPEWQEATFSDIRR